MRQVDQDELTWLLLYGLERLQPSVRAMMADRRPDQARKGAFFAAQQLAAQLGRLEVLSSAPPPPPFRFASIEGGSGSRMDAERLWRCRTIHRMFRSGRVGLCGGERLSPDAGDGVAETSGRKLLAPVQGALG